MPQLKEIRKGREIGRNTGHRFIWQACVYCSKERWVPFVRGNPKNLRCQSCYLKSRFGNKHPSWKGGRRWADGYIQIRVYPDDFFYPMAGKSGYILEHRLVVAKTLNRCLLPWEIVHHKGVKYPQGSIENKQDNRYPENLELLPTRKYHLVDAVSRSLIANLQKRVTLLEAENILLKGQIRSEADYFWGK